MLLYFVIYAALSQIQKLHFQPKKSGRVKNNILQVCQVQISLTLNYTWLHSMHQNNPTSPFPFEPQGFGVQSNKFRKYCIVCLPIDISRVNFYYCMDFGHSYLCSIESIELTNIQSAPQSTIYFPFCYHFCPL